MAQLDIFNGEEDKGNINTKLLHKRQTKMNKNSTKIEYNPYSDFSRETYDEQQQLRIYFGAGADRYFKRNYENIFGYPKNLTANLLEIAARRNALAAGVIRQLSDELWAEYPMIDSEGVPSLKTEWEQYCQEFNLYSTMLKIDKQALIFGEAYLMKYTLPTDPKIAPAEKAIIAGFETYNPTWLTAKRDRSGNIMGYKAMNTEIHKERIITIGHDVWVGDTFGHSALEPVINACYDYIKTLGASSESAWRAAIDLGVLTTSSNLDPTDAEKYGDMFARVLNGEKRAMVINSGNVSRHQMTALNPTPIIDKLTEAVAIATGIPKRILTGSEEGKLAGEQDHKSWQAQLNRRRKNECEPNVIKPIVKALQMSGQLPPSKDFKVHWERNKTDYERVQIMKDKSETIKNLATSSAMTANTQVREGIDEMMIETIEIGRN